MKLTARASVIGPVSAGSACSSKSMPNSGRPASTRAALNAAHPTGRTPLAATRFIHTVRAPSVGTSRPYPGTPAGSSRQTVAGTPNNSTAAFSPTASVAPTTAAARGPCTAIACHAPVGGATVTCSPNRYRSSVAQTTAASRPSSSSSVRSPRSITFTSARIRPVLAFNRNA